MEAICPFYNIIIYINLKACVIYMICNVTVRQTVASLLKIYNSDVVQKHKLYIIETQICDTTN